MRRTNFADFCTDILSRIFLPVSWQIFYIYDTQISTENIYRILVKQTTFLAIATSTSKRAGSKMRAIRRYRVQDQYVLSQENTRNVSNIWPTVHYILIVRTYSQNHNTAIRTVTSSVKRNSTNTHGRTINTNQENGGGGVCTMHSTVVQVKYWHRTASMHMTVD